MTYTESRKIPNSAEYQRLHRWVIKNLGKASYCSLNKEHQSTRYDWSNISKNYLPIFSDWRQLCRKCHRAYDPITSAGKKILQEKCRISSMGNKNHNIPVLMVYPNGSWIKYGSSMEAQIKTGVLYTSISNVLSGRSKTAGKVQWRRIAS